MASPIRLFSAIVAECKYARSVIALLIVTCLSCAVLTACGGGGSSGSDSGPHMVGGSATGITGQGLMLQINGQTTLTIPADGSFLFPTPIAMGSTYTVTVAAQPTKPVQNCLLSNGSGIMGSADVRNVQVTCTTLPPTLATTVGHLETSWTTSGGGPVLNVPLSFSVINPDVTDFYFTIAIEGSAISGIFPNHAATFVSNATVIPTNSAKPLTTGGTASWHGGFEGALNQVFFVSADSLGAGTYTDSITINACYDAACTSRVAGSPLRVPVTYIVTGNSQPLTELLFSYFPQVFQTGSTSTSTTGPTVSFTITGLIVPPTGVYIFARPGTQNLVNAITYQSQSDGANPPTVTVTASLKPGADLSAGVYSDTLEVKACFDLQCAAQATGSPWTTTIRDFVTASEGKDFVTKALNIEVNDLVWDAITKKIYALTSSGSPVNPNTITQIDPYTGAIERSYSLQSYQYTGGQLTISDDGQYLYAATTDHVFANAIERILTASLTYDATIALPTNEGAIAIKVAPAAPQTIAVSLGGSSSIVSVYDGTTKRTQDFIPTTWRNYIAWGASSSRLLAGEDIFDVGTVYDLSATATGLSKDVTTGNLHIGGWNTNDIHFVGTTLCWNTGETFDTVAHSLAPPFSMISTTQNTTLATAAVFDPSLDRAFFLNDDMPDFTAIFPITLESFRISDRQPQWIARFSSSVLPWKISRWGDDGLAFSIFTAGTSKLLIMNGAIVNK